MRQEQAGLERGRLRQHAHGSWSWRDRQENPLVGCLGILAAEGRGGKTTRVRHGFISALGTRFGEVEQRFARELSTSAARATPPAPTANEPPADRSGQEEPQDRTTRAIALVSQAVGRRLSWQPDDSQGQDNAFIDPREGDLVHVGSGISRRDLPTQVGILGHEVGHRLSNERRFKLAPQVQGALGAGRSTLEHSPDPTMVRAAQLVRVRLRRSSERIADRSGGRVLARVQKANGDRSMTPDAFVQFLRDAAERAGRWTPERGYDPVELRERAIRQAYERELARARPGGS